MPLKDSVKRREYHARYMKEVWYPKNRKRHLGYVRKNKKQVKEFIEQYKRERQCVDCGFSGKEYPQVLDFDHRDGKQNKAFEIGAWGKYVLSVARVQEEIEKCDLVCANCHRIRTTVRKVVL